MTTKHIRQPRLRASCDGCFLAKVKCSKDRPVCSRCLTVGLICQYSPSSRTGKTRPRGRREHLLASTLSDESCAELGRWLSQKHMPDVMPETPERVWARIGSFDQHSRNEARPYMAPAEPSFVSTHTAGFASISPESLLSEEPNWFFDDLNHPPGQQRFFQSQSSIPLCTNGLSYDSAPSLGILQQNYQHPQDWPRSYCPNTNPENRYSACLYVLEDLNAPIECETPVFPQTQQSGWDSHISAYERTADFS